MEETKKQDETAQLGVGAVSSMLPLHKFSINFNKQIK